MKSIIKIVFFLVSIATQPSLARCTTQAKQEISDTSFTRLHLTENAVDAFIRNKMAGTAAEDQVRRFYQSRDYQYAWLTEEGLAEQTQTLWGLYKQYQGFSKDSSLYDADLNQRLELLLSGEERMDPNNEGLELRLTAFFIRFLKHAYAGKVNPEKLQWHIPKKKLKVVDLLEELMLVNGPNLDEWLPVSAGYVAMKEKLIKLQRLSLSDWPVIS